jgi:hypothetical protein
MQEQDEVNQENTKERKQEEMAGEDCGTRKEIDQFEYIAAEIKRQHDLVTKIDDSLETKIGITLGFIFLVLSQIAFRSEFINLASKNTLLFVVFLCGLGAIFISILLGIKGFFFVTYYATGPRIEYMINAYENGDDLNQVISKGVSDAITLDIARSTEKASWLNRMLIAFIIGLALLIALEVGSIV